MTKSIWPALALTLAALGPAACGDDASPVAAGPSVAATNARLMLPAVKGNPGAVYFDLANNGERDMALSGAQVEGAQSAMIHATEPTGMQTITQMVIKAGETVKFAEGGTHVMAMGLADTIKPGETAEVTMHFLGGDEIHFPAMVHAAGDR